MHNLPPHLSYVSTLPDITQKLKRDIDELKHRQVGTYSSSHHRQSHWPMANTAVCTRKAKGRHFEHLLWSSHATGSFQSHSYYWDEDIILKCISLSAANVLYTVTFLVNSQVWWLFLNFFQWLPCHFFVGGPNRICIFYMRTDKCFI